jgi:hypothetical protein
MNKVAESHPPNNTTSVPLLRSPRTLRHLPIATLIELVDIARHHGEHVAGARVDDLRTEMRRREEAVR